MSSVKTARIILMASLIAVAGVGCERKAPDYVPRDAKGKETAAYADLNDGPRFIKIKKKDAQSKEAVARRRELKAKIKEKYKRGSFFD